MDGYLSLEYREPEPPEGWPLGKVELFYNQPFRMQCFIYLKYTKRWPKRLIKKYLFIVGECTYYKYNRKAKKLISEAYGNGDDK